VTGPWTSWWRSAGSRTSTRCGRNRHSPSSSRAFDGPARGIRCARSIVDGVRPLGIEVRAGLHTGEVSFQGDDVAGIGVAIGARVGAKAEPSEVLVSQTVKDLVAGSGIRFEDRGLHALKGVPDEWRLYAVSAD
jgi:class 3 adenylate cyclase